MNRIKQLRLAKGYSLEDLASAMGGIVTKQALSKYERGESLPSATVANRLAGALDTKTMNLWASPGITTRFIAYRKRSSLGKKKQASIECLVSQNLEQRWFFQERCYSAVPFDLPIQSIRVQTEGDAELAAEKIRGSWRLGLDPIADLTAILEDHRVHVLEIDAPENFDGISAVAVDTSGKTRAAAVVSRIGCPGDRQRLNLAHELAHLVLKVSQQLDEEKAAFRFAGAFLAPKACLTREVGEKRTAIELEELFILKKRFGMSLQAILRRLLDIAVISPTHYKWRCIQISQLGWRKTEPVKIQPERSDWLKQAALRCLAEGYITSEQAQKILGEKLAVKETPMRRRAFLNLPLEERRRILKEQSQAALQHYEKDHTWRDLQGGEVIEYDKPSA